jgi:hypothetical protein
MFELLKTAPEKALSISEGNTINPRRFSKQTQACVVTQAKSRLGAAFRLKPCAGDFD